jgi:hypothetical protein
MQLHKTEQITSILNFGKSVESLQVSAGLLGIMETVHTLLTRLIILGRGYFSFVVGCASSATR